MAITEDDIIKKLVEDEDFQKSLQKYKNAEERSSKESEKISLELVKTLDLQNPNLSVEEARFNLIIAKLTVAKALATLSSFSYDEKDFMDSLQAARECVQKELIPMLMQKEPCGECEMCKNGHTDDCIRPNIRSSHCESRFLPLLTNALIEYDAWSEILYSNIPHTKFDKDILQDINEEFQQSIQPKKRRGRPPKKVKED